MNIKKPRTSKTAVRKLAWPLLAGLVVLSLLPAMAVARRNLYVSNSGGTAPDKGSISGYDINQTTGALSLTAGSPVPTADGPVGLAVSGDGKRVYLTNFHADRVTAYDINQPSGSLTPSAGSPYAAAADGPVGVAIAPDGKRVYVAAYGQQTNPEDPATYVPGSGKVYGFDVNQTTGALTSLGGPAFSGLNAPEFQSVAITPNQGPAASAAGDIKVVRSSSLSLT